MSIFRHPMPALRDLNQKSSVAECAAHGIRCVTGCNVKVPLRKVSVFAMFPGSCFSHKKTSHLLEWGKNDIPIIRIIAEVTTKTYFQPTIKPDINYKLKKVLGYYQPTVRSKRESVHLYSLRYCLCKSTSMF